MLPRGIRNCNPGNVDYDNNIEWEGQIGIEDGPDARFILFAEMKWGIRCLVKIVSNYVKIDKVNCSVRGIISRWAPNNENNTEKYMENVAAVLGVGVDDIIDLSSVDVLYKLLKGIVIQECGEDAFDLITEEEMSEGVNLALSGE
jgi:hypothetical protein